MTQTCMFTMIFLSLHFLYAQHGLIAQLKVEKKVIFMKLQIKTKNLTKKKQFF